MDESSSRPERAARLEIIFDEAIDLVPAARSAYLDTQCAGDAELRRDIETLLDAFDTHAADVRRMLEDLPLAGVATSAADGAGASDGGGMSGRRVGPYQILKKLGGGGMGVVYLARDVRLERLAALKFLPIYMSADEDAKARFINEAKAASALDDARICTVYDIGETEDGQLFIAMAYYEGETLAEKIAAGPLSIRDALGYAIQVAEGLDTAHARGIIHRDIKPANLLVTTGNAVKILDFGIAKVSGVSLTITGVTPGTVAYMSPEQVQGNDVDHRTDVWSLGVVIYEMLTGRKPFDGDYYQATLYAILHTDPEPIATSVPDAPPALEHVVAKALAKAADERYQDLDALLNDLRAVAGAIDTGSHASLPHLSRPARRIRRGHVVGASIVLVILLLAGGYYALGDRILSRRAVTSMVVLPLQNQSLDAGEEYFVAGMHDAMIGALSQIGSLRVISRTSAMRYTGSGKSIPEIARELNVDGVVEGSVYREGREVRIQVRLIQAHPEERSLWAETFQQDLQNVPAMHGEVARAIARQIRATLSPDEDSRLASARPVNVETYEAYLRGMYHLNKSTAEDFDRGLDYLHEAVDKDPADARAYTGLAYGYITLGHGSGAERDTWARARAAVERALGLDSTLAEAWAGLADIKLYHEWDWEGAERAFRKANSLNPNLAMNHYHYAWYLILMGRIEEAVVEHRRAQELDPLTPLHSVWIPGIYLWSGRYEEALDVARRTVEEYPENATALFVLGNSAAEMGLFDEAIAAHEKAAAINPRWKFALGRSYALAGRTGDARRILAEVEALPPNPWNAYGLTCLHAALGNEDEAFRWLMYEPPHGWVAWSVRDPMMAPLWDDPRFDVLRRRLAVPGAEIRSAAELPRLGAGRQDARAIGRVGEPATGPVARDYGESAEYLPRGEHG